MLTGTHARTHACTHAHTQASRNARTQTCTHACMRASKQARVRCFSRPTHLPTQKTRYWPYRFRGTLPATTRAPLAPGLNPLCVLSPPAAMGARAQWHRGPSGCSGARPPGGRWGSERLRWSCQSSGGVCQEGGSEGWDRGLEGGQWGRLGAGKACQGHLPDKVRTRDTRGGARSRKNTVWCGTSLHLGGARGAATNSPNPSL